jgi:hypothetical protein
VQCIAAEHRARADQLLPDRSSKMASIKAIIGDSDRRGHAVGLSHVQCQALPLDLPWQLDRESGRTAIL